MRSLSLKCFGVGDGWPSPDRSHSSFLYTLAGTKFLIDCGEPVSRSYKASGLGYDQVERILLSHSHFDHIGGYFMLLQGFWLEKRRKDLPVHLPGGVIEPIRAMLQAGHIFPELLPFKVQYIPLRAGAPIEFSGISVTPYPTTHLESLRRAFQPSYPNHSFEAFSFLIEGHGWRIIHSADLGAPEDLDPLLREPVDLLLCELAHFEPEALFAYLKGRPIKRILLKHLSAALWDRRAELERAAARELGNCQFLKDGAEIQME